MHSGNQDESSTLVSFPNSFKTPPQKRPTQTHTLPSMSSSSSISQTFERCRGSFFIAMLIKAPTPTRNRTRTRAPRMMGVLSISKTATEGRRSATEALVRSKVSWRFCSHQQYIKSGEIGLLTCLAWEQTTETKTR